MEKKKLLILDSNQQMRTKIREHFQNSDRVDVVADFENLDNALDYIEKEEIDIVVSDLVFPRIDGITFLERLRDKNLAHAPKVIIVSSLYEDNLVKQALQLGVSYYMLKPIDYDALEKRINDILETSVVSSVPSKNIKNKALEEKITNIFLTVGIPAHIKGYQFLREAIKMAIDNPEIINSITKKLYPSIANRFETSASKVERAIRHAIEVAWNRGKIENINTLFGIRVYSNNEKPTNGEFIALVADKMLIEGA